MSNESGNENDDMEYIHNVSSLEDDALSDMEQVSDDENRNNDCVFNDEYMTYDLNNERYPERDFEPLREDDIFVMMQMIQSNGTAPSYPLRVRSCGDLTDLNYSKRTGSSRSYFSWNGVDPLEGLQGRLYRFYSPQYGHAALKRCISEIEINILRSQSCFCSFSSEFSQYSPGSVNISLMDDSNSESYYFNIDEYFNYEMDDLSEMFENMHITSDTPCRRVRRIFNLKTWTGAIYQEPNSPEEQARLLPLEKAWQFVEFHRNSPKRPGKRYADWCTTDHVPEEKKRKDRNIY